MATKPKAAPPPPLELTPIAATSPAAPAHLPAVQAPAATPMALLQMAVQQGADMEKLERLMALQERWESNEARKAFVAAMSAFKTSDLAPIFKRKKVGYETQDGGFVGYSHAELSDVAEVVGPAMAKHGLYYRWDVEQIGGRVKVACVVTHEKGHSERVVMDAAPDASGKKNAVQQIASAVTYLSRYTLLAITGMSTRGMDNDGAGDGDDGTDAPPPPPPPPPAPAVYDEASFKKNLPSWRDLIQSGKKTAAQVISVAARKAPLTQSQQDQLRKLEPAPKRGGDFGDVLDEHGNPV